MVCSPNRRGSRQRCAARERGRSTRTVMPSCSALRATKVTATAGWAIEKVAPFGFDAGEDGSKAGEVVDKLPWVSRLGIETVIGWVVGLDRIEPLEVSGRELPSLKL